MISRLIRASFQAPLLTVLLAAAGTTIGAFWMLDLRRDVFPDLSAPVFNVITQNPAMGAEELETAIAIPLEVALAGLPDVRRVRSNSQLGVAQVTIEFDPNADYYRSRQFVAERVSQVSGQLPAGTDPPLISSLTGRLNEIFEFTLEADPGAVAVAGVDGVLHELDHSIEPWNVAGFLAQKQQSEVGLLLAGNFPDHFVSSRESHDDEVTQPSSFLRLTGVEFSFERQETSLHVVRPTAAEPTRRGEVESSGVDNARRQLEDGSRSTSMVEIDAGVLCFVLNSTFRTCHAVGVGP